MFFLIDTQRKIVFGWSAKCGCSHVKRIFWFLQNDEQGIDDPHQKDKNSLPADIENYTIIVVCRNPYKRLVSGVLDKYQNGKPFKLMWKHDTITFSMFVNELVKADWNMVEQHHFEPQTDGLFDKKIMAAKSIKFYDICSIDYSYIEELYSTKIPDAILQQKEGHERKLYDIGFDRYVYDLNMEDYYNFNVDIGYFYSDELQDKVYKFYENDFVFFKENGIDYTAPAKHTS